MNLKNLVLYVMLKFLSFFNLRQEKKKILKMQNIISLKKETGKPLIT